MKKITVVVLITTNISIAHKEWVHQLVAELVNDLKQPGSYTVTFDGTNLASGIYFYKLEAGNYHDSKKMLLVK